MTSVPSARLEPGIDTCSPLNVRKRIGLIVPYVSDKSRVLDVGCGHGGYIPSLCELTPNACGVEQLADRVEAFRQQHPELRDAIYHGDAQQLPFPADHFDTVLLNEVLEHVQDENKALREIYRVLRPGGVLIVFSPNRCYPVETHGVVWRRESRGVTLLVPYLPLSLWPKLSLGMRARNYWPHELRKIVAAAGFKVTHYDFVTQTFENNTGAQSALARHAAPALRAIFGAAGRLPLLRRFVSVSQMVVGAKQE